MSDDELKKELLSYITKQYPKVATIIKDNAMLTEMIAKDHEIIQQLKLELFLERHRNDR